MEAYATQDTPDVPPAYDDGSRPEKCGCWDKWWFILIAIVVWILLIGFIALNVFTGVEWSIYNTELEELQEKNRVIDDEWTLVNATLKDLREQIDGNRTLLEAERKKLEELKAKQKKLSDEYHEKSVEFSGLKKQYTDILAEINRYKTENKALVEKNAEIKNQIESLKKEIAELEAKAKSAVEENKIFKYLSFTIWGVFVLGTADDVYTHIQLWNLQDESKKLYPQVAGFDKLSEGYEDYEIMRWKFKQSVVRTTCFHGFTKDFSNCQNKGPFIVTFMTDQGYKFGGCLNVSFPDHNTNVADEDAFTFSHAHGEVTGIADPHNAFVRDDSVLLQFGEDDIKLPLSSKQVSLGEKTYSIPHPYTKEDFYVNGTTCTITSIIIDLIDAK